MHVRLEDRTQSTEYARVEARQTPLQQSCATSQRNADHMCHLRHRFATAAVARHNGVSAAIEETNMRSALILGGASVLVAAVAAHAQTPPVARPVAALQQCRSVADPQARLACYDKAVDVLAAATASGDTVVVERTEVRKARKGLFGFTLPRIGFLTGREDNAEDVADASALETTIVSARPTRDGKWRFSVEGGATWETVEANLGFSDPVPGAKVLLEKGSLGAYFVKVGKGRRVQAKRIG
jgi:hypothetical protein